MDLQIRIDNKHFGDKKVFEKAGFDIKGSGICLLTGENGAGKSTLLSILSGNDLDYEGDFLVDGTSICKKTVGHYQERIVSYCPQDPLLFEDLSLVDNVLFPYHEKNREEAEKILERLGLGKLLDHDVQTLSAGERQRLAFARALYAKKPLLLLDECTADLDADSTDILLSCLKELSTDHLILFATHDEHAIAVLEDAEVLKLEDGTIHQLRQGKWNAGSSSGKAIGKTGFFTRLQDAFRFVSPFSAWSFALLTFLVAFALLFESLAISFSSETNRVRITEEYVHSAQAIQLVERKEGFHPLDGTAFVLTAQGPYNLSEERAVGNRILGVLSTSDFSYFETRLSSGRLPKKDGELLLPSTCAEIIEEISGKTDILGLDMQDVSISFPFKGNIVGIFEADVGDYGQRKEWISDHGAPLAYTVSYGFFSECCFAYGTDDDINPLFVLPMEQNVRQLAIEDIYDFSLYQNKDGFSPYCPIEVDKDGNNPFANRFFTSTGAWSAFFGLFLALSFFFPLLFLVVFFLRNRRQVLLLRVCGRSREDLDTTMTLGFVVPSLFGILVGLALGLLSILALDLSYASVLLSGSMVFLYPWQAVLGLIPLALVVLLVPLYVIWKRLSPSDLSHLLYEIKRK